MPPTTTGGLTEDATWVFQFRHASKTYADRMVLDDVSLSLPPRARIGVVGPDGTGKSTLLKMMAALEEPSTGEAALAPGISVGIILQEPVLDGATVRDYVEAGVADVRATLARFEEIAVRLSDAYTEGLVDELGRLEERLDHDHGWDLDSRLEQAMDALRCPPPQARVAALASGERHRVALCRLLLQEPDLLLLDEPTNHLQAGSVEWLQQRLEAYPGTVVAITHDRRLLDRVAEWILELDGGHTYAYEGSYTTYLETKAARLATAGAEDAKRKSIL